MAARTGLASVSSACLLNSSVGRCGVEPDALNAPDLAPRPRLRLLRPQIAIHEFGRHRHHDQSKNPAHHTTGSKLAPRQAVLKFNAATPFSARECKPDRWRIAGRYQWMFAFFSNRLGCVGSIIVSVIGTLILLAVLRGCH